MRFQKTKFIKPDMLGPKSCVWDCTKDQAATRRRTLRELKMKNIETVEVDVPTDKTGLLNFLNEIHNV